MRQIHLMIRLIMKAIKKKSLADEVALQLRRQIERGKMKEGEKLPTEPQLMEIFGVGRSSVREAIQQLALSGYLSVEQGRGTFVKNVSPSNDSWEQRIKRADIQELREARDLLDTTIAQLAALRHNDEDIREMETALQKRGRTAEEGRLQDCITADVAFHLAIAKATHNSILTEMYQLVAEAQQSGWQQIYDDTSKLIRSQQRHEQLFMDIRNRNTEEIAKSNRELLAHIWDK